MKKTFPLIVLVLLLIIAISPALFNKMRQWGSNRRKLTMVTSFITQRQFDRADSLLQTTCPYVFGLKGREKDSADLSRDSSAVGARFRWTLQNTFKYNAVDDSTGLPALKRCLDSLPPSLRTIAKIEASHYLKKKFTGLPGYQALLVKMLLPLSAAEDSIAKKWYTDTHGTMGFLETIGMLVIMYCGANFLFISFLLFLAIVIQGFVAWKNPQCQQVFAGLTLEWRDYAIFASLYLAPPLVAILPGRMQLHIGPSFINERHLSAMVLAYLLLILPGAIYARLHRLAHNMTSLTQDDAASDLAVMWNSLLNEYKEYLWRLWPASLIMTVIGVATLLASWAMW